MAKRRNTTKQDEELLLDVVEVKDNAQDFIEKNKTMVIGVLAAIILLVGAWIVYKYVIQGPNEVKAANAIHKAEYQFARDSFALALENPGGGYDGFLDIIDSYGSTKTGNIAKYYAGISYLNLGRYDDAISYLESYSPDGELTPMTKYGAMGDAYAEKGDLDKALSLYNKAANAEKNELLTPYYLQKVGELSLKQGDTSAAAAAFKNIKENYPTSAQGNDVDRFLAQVQ